MRPMCHWKGCREYAVADNFCAGHHPATGVPRRASFDDLRVGQWVAWVEYPGGGDARLALIESIDRTAVARARTEDGVLLDIAEGWALVIMVDAPVSPVTVRREDYDALGTALERTSDLGTPVDPLATAARALIDNAEGADRLPGKDYCVKCGAARENHSPGGSRFGSCEYEAAQ